MNLPSVKSNTQRKNPSLFIKISAFLYLVFSHNLYAEVPLSEQRIISLAPHITEMLYAVGAGEDIVATVSYSDYPEAAKSIPQIGSYDKINYEALLAMKPTLVIGWQSGNGDESLQRIKELATETGIATHNHDPKTLEDVAQSLAIFGELTNRIEEGKKASFDFLQRLEKIKEVYANRSKVSIYYQLWNEPQMTVNDDHLIADVIRLCSGENIFADAIPLVPKIGIESVLQRAPEVIIATGMSGARPDWLDDWYKWSSIPAVKNEHLYHIHPDLLHRHSPRILEGAEQLCEALDKAR